LFDDDTPPKHFEHTPRLVAFPGKCRINITDIGASDHTGIAIADNGDVYTWGFASCGATGHYDERDLGLDLDIHRPQKLELNFGGSRRVLQASGGGDHVAMIVSPAASTH
jgi:alpha-tubulin suppressor-like RCC1 family protein